MTGQGDAGHGARTATWGVVMTVCEPASLILANVLWHLKTGACEVFVYFDDPKDPAIAALQVIEGCRLVSCDKRYWSAARGKKGRPRSQMRRQAVNANAAQGQTKADWLFHIDADEFIWQDNPLHRELASVSTSLHEVSLPVVERLFPMGGQAHLFDGAFRKTADLSDPDAQAAYGSFAAFMKRGQYSHGAGKSGVRAGAGLQLGVHNALTRRDGKWRRSDRHIATGTRLLHFDGLTPLHWALKFIRYRLTPPDVQTSILQPHRMAQIDWMVERSETLEAAKAAHTTLFKLTPDRRARLEKFDLLDELAFDPTDILGTQAPDLSCAGFDADLLARNPWLHDFIDAGNGD
ncbi:MAG: glycosyltransferase family 2 protein [Pseudomonadota bacterium]